MRKKNRYRYDLVMNKEEHDILNSLREEYAINISKCFKNFLKKYFNELEKSNIKKI